MTPATLKLATDLNAKEREIMEILAHVDVAVGRNRETAIARTQIELGFLMAHKAIAQTLSFNEPLKPPFNLPPGRSFGRPTLVSDTDCAQQSER